MNELKPLICTQCGGKINPRTLKCEYCGTEYKNEYSGSEQTLHICTYQPGVNVVKVGLHISHREMYEMRRSMSSQEISERVVRALSEKLAETIEPYMVIESEIDTGFFKGSVRVLDPDYQF